MRLSDIAKTRYTSKPLTQPARFLPIPLQSLKPCCVTRHRRVNFTAVAFFDRQHRRRQGAHCQRHAGRFCFANAPKIT